jgi:hypothetical protein
MTPSYESHAIDTHYCGHSVSDAKAADCVFDVLAPGWLPRPCQDLTLLNEFRSAGPWRYYLDPVGQREISEEHLSDLELGGPFYTSQREHVVHCAFAWHKMHRSIEAGRNLEGYLKVYNHTVHCGVVFMHGRGSEELNTINVVGLGSC